MYSMNFFVRELLHLFIGFGFGFGCILITLRSNKETVTKLLLMFSIICTLSFALNEIYLYPYTTYNVYAIWEIPKSEVYQWSVNHSIQMSIKGWIDLLTKSIGLWVISIIMIWRKK